MQLKKKKKVNYSVRRWYEYAHTVTYNQVNSFYFVPVEINGWKDCWVVYLGIAKPPGLHLFNYVCVDI